MIIHRDVAEHLFTGFSIKRWNDLVRPMELNEMDRRAFAAMTTYFLAKLEEEQGNEVDWNIIIDASVFDLLRKLAISDIKESVHRDIRTHYPVEYRKLNEWVVSTVSPMLDRYGLADRFSDFLLGDDTDDSRSKARSRSRHILEAARTYSSHREFQIIKAVNYHDPRVPDIEDDLRRRLEPYLDLVGMRQLVLELDLYRLIGVVDRLRYQVRWSRTPRIPETAVLGHSLMVCVFVYLLSHQANACDRRKYNNFFAALFHDLPEAVTRDIVAPTKTATPGLPEIVKTIEDRTVAEEIYPHMSAATGEEIRYFTENEFASRISTADGVAMSSFAEIQARYNEDRYNPVDGDMIRVADEFSAFLEAWQSIQFGVSSPVLEEGIERLRALYTTRTEVAGVRTAEMFAQFP